MSVYTRIDHPDLEEFLRSYSLGTLEHFSGISAGIENTNYFVTTTHGSFVLTLFETMGPAELPYFLDLMAHLAEHGVPSAHPVADIQGHYLRSLKDKPAALVQRLSGADVKHPTAAQCGALGKALGHLHRAGQSFTGQRANDRGPAWRNATAAKVLPQLTSEDAALLQAELHFHAQTPPAELPRGVIHADLFRDNALFVGDMLTGIIDFYYACNDALLYDVAVTANDWCSRADGSLDSACLEILLAAYQQQRPLTRPEHIAWPAMLRAAALRFWLSRLHDMHFPRKGEITHIKDPDVFKRILLQRQQESHCALLGML
ncbi:MAG TPA: homoserine kinase [Gammaproteobacteria bacterium]|nr:homoserine kinase [Gammaproteobacteria bacterium]